jgi:hypothetical protein
MEVSWDRMRCSGAVLTCLDVLVGWVVDAPLIWCPQNSVCPCRPWRTHRGSCIHLESLVISWRKLDMFLWCRPTDWILCWAEYGRPAQGRKAPELGLLSDLLILDDSWGHCESAGLCNCSVWTGTPTVHADCLHCRELQPSGPVDQWTSVESPPLKVLFKL